MLHQACALSGALAAVWLAGCTAADQTPSAVKSLVWPSYPGTPGSGLRLQTLVPQQNRTAPGSILPDIVSHLPASYGNTYYDSDLVTWGHETSHGLSAHIRNNLNNTGRKANGFYLLDSRAAVVVEPAILKHKAAAYIPQSLRGSRFSMYVTGQGAWDDTPLYILDEWNAYINGGAAGVDLVQRGLWTQGNRDAVEGIIEFVVYSLAVAMAVQELDPDYFATQTQFAEFLAWNTARAMAVFRQGAGLEPFRRESQERYFETLRQAAEAAPLRAFADRLFGSEWTARILLAPLEDTTLAVLPPSAGGGQADSDSDSDGVADHLDRCQRTPPGSIVWTTGDWIGCAGGQTRDQ